MAMSRQRVDHPSVAAPPERGTRRQFPAHGILLDARTGRRRLPRARDLSLDPHHRPELHRPRRLRRGEQVGAENYTRMLDDSAFWNTVGVTVTFIGAGVVLELILAWTLAPPARAPSLEAQPRHARRVRHPDDALSRGHRHHLAGLLNPAVRPDQRAARHAEHRLGG